MAQHQKAILIIEDDLSLLAALNEKLEQADFLVLQADNGERGLHVAMEQHPDLILLDILMPRLNGLKMLQDLRADEWGETCPVIVLSNVVDADKIAEAKRLQVLDYFVKTEHRLEDLVKKIKKVL